MTDLKCTVQNCANYHQEMCCRPDIKVTGACACGCEQTNCGSFEERSGDPKNACGCNVPNQALDVACEAKNCTYNANGKCAADCICVETSVSCGRTDCCSQTECATFRLK